MNDACDPLFAGARLTHDERGGATLTGEADLVRDAAHRQGLARQRLQGEGPVQPFAKHGQALWQRRDARRLLDRHGRDLAQHPHASLPVLHRQEIDVPPKNDAFEAGDPAAHVGRAAFEHLGGRRQRRGQGFQRARVARTAPAHQAAHLRQRKIGDFFPARIHGQQAAILIEKEKRVARVLQKGLPARSEIHRWAGNHSRRGPAMILRLPIRWSSPA